MRGRHARRAAQRTRCASLWRRRCSLRGCATSSTVASQYATLGISLRWANTERVSGWAEVLHRLGDPRNGVPARLFIHEWCARLIECLPSLHHDPNRPEDVLKVDADEDGVGGDDAADCLRYLVATKERKVTQRKLRGF